MTDVARAYSENCSPLDAATARLLVDAGIDPRLFLVRGLVRVARVRSAGQFFEFDPDGRRAFITPVCGMPDGELEYPGGADHLDHFPVVDLVGWHPLRPERWRLLRGSVTCAGITDTQEIAPEPTPIYRSVLSWLQGGARGLVFLTDSPQEQQAILQRLATIEAEDAQHAAELRRIASMPIKSPRITIRRTATKERAA